jgi:hypothetical protein
MRQRRWWSGSGRHHRLLEAGELVVAKLVDFQQVAAFA